MVSLSDREDSIAEKQEEQERNFQPLRHKAPPPDVSLPTIWKYLITRPTTLFQLPILQQDEKKSSIKDLNPLPAIRAMKLTHWNKFLHGWMAWSVDSMDFFCVSVSASAIAKTLDVNVKSITWGITLVLMLRSVGSIIFGYCADRWGRKWPLIACYLLFVILEIATGFVQNLKQFLAIRSLFGVAMGGCYSMACSTALEDCPQISRGFLSGIFLPGYNWGFILATVFYRAFSTTEKDWRALFWFSAAPPFLMIIWRLSFDEMEYFKELKEARNLHNQRVQEAQDAGVLSGDQDMEKITIFSEFKELFRTDWPLLSFLLLLMSAFNFISHGSQDLFPTMLSKQLHLSADAATVTNVVYNLGAMIGGIFWGQCSELIGRRLAIICCCIWGGAFLYGTFLTHHQSNVMGFGFLLQFAVMGAWGVLPVYLTELCSRSSLRTLISGTAYQLGNLASSASSTIEAELGSQFPLEGDGVYDYGKVMCIFMGCVFAFLLTVLFFGPERFHEEIKTEFMLNLEDIDKEYELDKVLNPVPHSKFEEKFNAAVHIENAYKEKHDKENRLV